MISNNEMPGECSAVYLEAMIDMPCDMPEVFKQIRYVRALTNEAGGTNYYLFWMEGSGNENSSGFALLDTENMIYAQGDSPDSLCAVALNEEEGEERFMEADADTAALFEEIKETALELYLEGTNDEYVWTLKSELCEQMKSDEGEGTRYLLEDDYELFKAIAQFKAVPSVYRQIADLEY